MLCTFCALPDLPMESSMLLPLILFLGSMHPIRGHMTSCNTIRGESTFVTWDCFKRALQFFLIKACIKITHSVTIPAQCQGTFIGFAMKRLNLWYETVSVLPSTPSRKTDRRLWCIYTLLLCWWMHTSSPLRVKFLNCVQGPLHAFLGIAQNPTLRHIYWASYPSIAEIRQFRAPHDTRREEHSDIDFFSGTVFTIRDTAINLNNARGRAAVDNDAWWRYLNG